jgi:hypothetical protein
VTGYKEELNERLQMQESGWRDPFHVTPIGRVNLRIDELAEAQALENNRLRERIARQQAQIDCLTEVLVRHGLLSAQKAGPDDGGRT